MAGQTIGGLFKDQSRGEKALSELHAAGFTSAQISEVEDESASTPPPKLGNPVTDFFKDHQSTGTEFRDNLAELGISAADADYFEDGVARGGALVTVKADARASEAVAILQQHGADLGSMGRSGSTTPQTGAVLGAAGAAGAGTMAAGRPSADTDEAQLLELKAERLSIDKVRVASGSVRIGKRVVSEQQSIDVPVSHEELFIERRPVTDGARGGTIGADETITIPLSREEVKVGKEAFVTEEIDVGKKAVGGVEHVSDTVRHEELVVDGDMRPEPPIR